MTYKLMYSVEGSLEQWSLQRAILPSRRHPVKFEVTCDCPTGGGGGLLASPGEGQGQWWTSYRAQDYGEAPAPHRLPRMRCLPQSRSHGRHPGSTKRLAWKQDRSGHEKGDSSGKSCFPIAPMEVKLLAPLRPTQIPSHPWSSSPQSLIFPQWSCRG